MTENSFSLKTYHRENKFFLLVLSLLLLFIVYPFTRERIFGLSLLDIFLFAVLLASVYAVSTNKRIFLISLILAVLSLLTMAGNEFVQSKPLFLLYLFSIISFVIIMVITILHHIFQSRKITADTIFGAICVYLFLGIIWAFLFSALELLHSGSFLFGESISGEMAHGRSFRSLNSVFFYYSFVTLTTLGYGDVTPVIPVARSFAVLEAITGQLYIAVLIARLVGLHITDSMKSK